MSDFGALEPHQLPNGSHVFYRDSDHAYYREVVERKAGWCGKGRLTGVSTVTAPFDFKPDLLMKWAARMNGEGIAVLAAEGLSLEDADDMRSALRWLESAESIWGALLDAELTYEHLRDASAASGTAIHKHALHALSTGRPVPDLDVLSDEERGCAQGVMAFWLDCDPEPLQSEQVVADLELGVAGRLDLRCLLGAGRYRGETVMVDAKSKLGDSRYVPIKHHAQLAGYEHCARVCGVGESDRQLILLVDAEGGYELIEGQADAEDFGFGVEVYRRSARIGSAAKRARKAAAEAEQVAA